MGLGGAARAPYPRNPVGLGVEKCQDVHRHGEDLEKGTKVREDTSGRRGRAGSGSEDERGSSWAVGSAQEQRPRMEAGR